MTASIPAAWVLFSTASAWHNKAPVKQLIGRLAMGAQQGRSWLYAVHDRHTERYTTHKGDFDLSQFSDMSDTSDISYYLTCICSYHCGQALQLNKTIHHIQFAKITHPPAQHNALRSSKYKTLAAEEVRSYRCRVTQCHTYVIHLESELIRWVGCAARLISTADMQDMQDMPVEQDWTGCRENSQQLLESGYSWHAWHSISKHKRASTFESEVNWPTQRKLSKKLSRRIPVLGLSWTSRAGVRLACRLTGEWWWINGECLLVAVCHSVSLEWGGRCL